MRNAKAEEPPAEPALPAAPPALDLEALRGRLAGLELHFAAGALSEHLTQAVKENWGPPAFLERLLKLEQERREERRIRVGLKLSGLPSGQTTGNFDFAFQPAVARSKIEALATCTWVREKQALLLLGPAGVGKTHLAVALGVKAVECGCSVVFYRLDELLHALRKDAELAPARLKGKKYMNAALVIVDEMGFQPLTRAEANLFFRMVSYRYQRGSLCLTSNKGIKDWPEMLAGDEALAMAILDRLLHASHVLNIRGRSYRLRELEETFKREGQAGLQGAVSETTISAGQSKEPSPAAVSAGSA